MPKVSEDYKEKRRLEILEAAEKVFIEKGFSGTTMTDIVNATGLSRGGLYHYFSSTDEVFQAILQEQDRDVALYFERLGTEYEKIWDGINTYLTAVDNALTNPVNIIAPVNIEYFILGRHDKDRMDYLNSRLEQGSKMFAGLLNKGIERNEFKPFQSTETISMFIISVVDSLHIQAIALGYEKSHVQGQIEGLRIYLKQVLGLD